MATHAPRPGGPRITPPHPGRPEGFSLIELILVVAILGILAALVVPRFSTASDTSRENALKGTVYRVRQQIEVYKQEHGGDWPSLAAFESQMTQSSNDAGATAAVGTAGYPHGPYLRAMPVNPYTGGRDVSAGAVGASSWYYDETTGDFRANHDAEARAF